MQGREFRKWAEQSFRYYGRNPWYFLRELAQNSRDSGAQTIWIETECTPDGQEVLTFADDGCGMTYEHARRYLFRLYASSKTHDKYSAGMYGSGFWTVLRYNPSDIIIDSRTRKEHWAVSLDASFRIKKIPSHLRRKGTRITLTRKAQFKNHYEFQHVAEKELIRFCGYLRRNNRNFSRLPVIFRGKNITLPLKLPGPVTLTFREGPVEGAVGLGRKPKVYLYARGLPVWEGTILEELSHTMPSKIKNCEVGWGLAPVFLLNGNKLDVTMSRKATIDNRAFKKLYKVAQRSLSKLIQISADKAVPRRWSDRMIDFLKRNCSVLIRSPFKLIVLLLIVILPLEVMILNKIYPHERPESRADSILNSEKSQYLGADVIHSTHTRAVDMSYHPPENIWFKIFTADLYTIKSGFVQDTKQSRYSFSFPYQSRNRPISIQLRTSQGGRLFLPQPVGYTVDAKSVILDQNVRVFPKYSTSSEAIIHISENGGSIQYQCFPINPNKALSQSEIIRLTSLPEELEFPTFSDRLLGEYTKLNIDKKASKALALTGSLLKYDASAQTAAEYSRSGDQPEWFSRVLHIGRGDCDVLNSVVVLFLRRMGIPARLAVGLVGENGQIRPGLHAWTEYFNQGWHTVDASQFTPPFQGIIFSPSSRSQPQDASSKTSLIPSGFSENIRNYLPYLCIGALLSFFIILLKIQKKRQRTCKIQDSNTIKDSLAQMAIRAMLQPEAWGGYNSHIWYSRIIPTLNGKPISLKQALRLQKSGKLFIGQKKHNLTIQSIKAGIPILDKDNRTFAPLIRMFPGSIDLDLIAELKAVPPEKMKSDKVARLLAHVNQILKKIEKTSVQCMWAPGLGKQDFFDVNLPPLSRILNSDWSGQFIAVNPRNPKILSLADMYQKNPPLGVYRLIKCLLRESEFVFSSKENIQKKASLLLLKEIG